MRIDWGDRIDTLPERSKSLQRFYPPGQVTMQFAFYRDVSDTLIELLPALGVGPTAIVRTLAELHGARPRVVLQGRRARVYVVTSSSDDASPQGARAGTRGKVLWIHRKHSAT